MPAASKDLSLRELGMMCDPGKMSVNAVVVLIFKTNVQYLDILKSIYSCRLMPSDGEAL